MENASQSYITKKHVSPSIAITVRTNGQTFAVEDIPIVAWKLQHTAKLWYYKLLARECYPTLSIWLFSREKSTSRLFAKLLHLMLLLTLIVYYTRS